MRLTILISVVFLFTSLRPIGMIFAEDTEGQIIYQNSFENPEDELKLYSIQSPAGNVPSETGILQAGGLEGSSAFYFESKPIRKGYFYVYLNFPKPVALGDGPLYISGYMKGTWRIQNTCIGLRWPGAIAGREPAPTRKKGKDGWYHIFTDDLSKRTKGEKAFGLFIPMYDVQAGEPISFLIDDLCLTQVNPGPPLDPKLYQEKFNLYQKIQSEWKARTGTDADTALEKKISARITQIDTFLKDESILEPARRTMLVGEMRSLEKVYWEYKFQKMAPRTIE